MRANFNIEDTQANENDNLTANHSSMTELGRQPPLILHKIYGLMVLFELLYLGLTLLNIWLYVERGINDASAVFHIVSVFVMIFTFIVMLFPPFHATKIMIGKSYGSILFGVVGSIIGILVLFILPFFSDLIKSFLYSPLTWLSMILFSMNVVLLGYFASILKKSGYINLTTGRDYFNYFKKAFNGNTEIPLASISEKFKRPVDKIVLKWKSWNRREFLGMIDPATMILHLNDRPLKAPMEYCDFFRKTWGKAGGFDIAMIADLLGQKRGFLEKKLKEWTKKGYLLGAIDKKKGLYSFKASAIDTKQENAARSPSIDDQSSKLVYKTRLIGMIKAMKKIDLRQAPAMLGMEKQALQQLLFELVGEDKVNGEFSDENTFVITGGIDAFISALDDQFKNWGEKERTKEGKLDDVPVTKSNDQSSFASSVFTCNVCWEQFETQEKLLDHKRDSNHW